jgi:hypothetical protein
MYMSKTTMGHPLHCHTKHTLSDAVEQNKSLAEQPYEETYVRCLITFYGHKQVDTSWVEVAALK